MDEILEILKYTIPSLITAGIAAYFLKQFIKIERSKNNIELLKHKKQESLPLKLAAYERMALFLERIDIISLIQRVQPYEGSNKIQYSKVLIATINNEYEHNLVQQIYMSHHCWEGIQKAKDTTLNIITALSMDNHIKSGDDLSLALQKEFHNDKSPSDLALQMIKKEVQKLF